MPELPEVETVMRGLRTRLEGRRILRAEVRVPALRWPLPRDLGERLGQRRVLGLRRRAKYILIDLDDREVLLAHLGMSGRMLLLPRGSNRPLDKHDHLILVTDEGWELRFNDARRFGMLDLVATEDLAGHRLLKTLGPEPLGPDFDGAFLAGALAGKSTPIKAALLDQRLVAGLGNIYVSEALFRAGISPRRLARSVQGRRAEALVQAVREVLEQAIAAGGSSLRDYVQSDGELGYFQHQWAVYGREGEACINAACGQKVRRLVQAGRSTFYCPRCQR
ncbi:MAG: bifunctional DNA-formamidopyrimidine glycosylase/DNA-(apurinic or apyrimidinic site) lyase [Rhodospirillales bacterium]